MHRWQRDEGVLARLLVAALIVLAKRRLAQPDELLRVQRPGASIARGRKDAVLELQLRTGMTGEGEVFRQHAVVPGVVVGSLGVQRRVVGG